MNLPVSTAVTSQPTPQQTHQASIAQFRQALAELTRQLAGKPLDAALDAWLNAEHGAGGASYRNLKTACETGVAQGWLCDREGGGIRYGRIFKPAPDLHGFSVDVVDMAPPRWAAPSKGLPPRGADGGTPPAGGEHDFIAGPHHAHPLGEIDLIMPIEGEATFDGRPAGWLVCPPGSAHRPTVAHGHALVLYLLPEGRIDFTR
jgi:Domain of unknown function (DUF4863)